jgi:hypothetical protein
VSRGVNLAAAPLLRLIADTIKFCAAEVRGSARSP